MKKFLVLILAVAGIALGATTYTTYYSLSKPGDRDRNYGSLIRGNFDTIDTQMKANSDANANHIADTVAAHAASAIVTTPGVNICTTQITVQDYLDCLDGLLDPGTSGVVLLTGAQTITGLKTFTVAPIMTSVPSGILTTDAGGVISPSTFGSISPLTTKGDLLVYTTDETRMAVGTDGYVLEADSTASEGIAWKAKNPRWRKYTFAYTDLSAAATSFSVTAFTLLAGEGIEGVVIKHNTAFAGGAISAYTVEVGVTGAESRYGSAFDVLQAASGTASLANNFLDVPDFGSTTDILVTARSTGADLDQAVAGSVDVYIRTFLLP